MRLAVVKERREGEHRVAAVPETVRKLAALDIEVAVEAGAGQAVGIADADYTDAGATIAPTAEAALQGATLILAVQPPEALLPRGALLLCISGAANAPGLAAHFAQAGIDVAALEWLPRITRAQSMDVLSSQANLAGYRAVIEGAAAFERGFPMMMTAAGTVPPARVLVIGAGVAGLQAIATARRLGAIVSATDVRPAAREEIKSLGATFVGVEDAETAQQTGAYAGQMSEAFRAKQAEVLAAAVAKSDLVICTALVAGGRAPVIITSAMVQSMRPGSVVVDIAADGGGNCEATRPGEAYTTKGGVRVLGYRNWPSRIAVAASALYARNLLTFVTTFWDKDSKALKLPEDDPIVAGVLLTRGGAVVHPRFQGEAAPAPAGAPTPAAPPEEPPIEPQLGDAIPVEPAPATPPARPAAARKTKAAPPPPDDDAPMPIVDGDGPVLEPASAAIHPLAADAPSKPRKRKKKSEDEA